MTNSHHLTQNTPNNSYNHQSDNCQNNNDNHQSSSDVRQAIDNLAQTPEIYRQQIHTFMKRRSHIGQKAELALTDDMFKTYLVNSTGVIGKLGDVSDIHDLKALFDNDNPITLEIGFGMGDSLIQMAQNAPNINFVGVEVHEPGIGRCVYLAYELGLKNLKIINGDALALLKNLPQGHLDTIQLYFPDPWQKKRHYKRRFVTPDRMQIVADALKTGGVFHTATDWEHYAFWMLDVLDNMPQFENMAGVGKFSPRPDFRPLTKFENRGINFGHGVWDLLYKKL